MDGSSTTLNLTTAMVGLLAVGGHTIDILWDLNTAPKDLTAPINQALHTVRECRSSIHVLYKSLISLQSSQLPFPERGSWIQVDELLATLTDTVLAFSKLHHLCEILEYEGATSSPEEACNRHTKRIRSLSARIRFHNLSMTMMMTILKCRGQSDAKRSRAELAHRIMRLLTFNTTLAARLRGQDTRSLSSRNSNSVPIVPGSTLPNYAASQTSDSGSSGLGISPAGSEVGRISPAWSTLSGLALGDIPLIPALRLPVALGELSDSTQFYAFTFSPQFIIGEMAETALVPETEGRMSRSSILGLSGESWQTDGMANITRQANNRAT